MFKTQRRWSPGEDAILREEVELQTSGTARQFKALIFGTDNGMALAAQEGKPINWNEVAKRIPSRSNKDCRKRFYNEVTGGLKKVSVPQYKDDSNRQFSDWGQTGPVDRRGRLETWRLSGTIWHVVGCDCSGNGNTKRRSWVCQSSNPQLRSATAKRRTY